MSISFSLYHHCNYKFYSARRTDLAVHVQPGDYAQTFVRHIVIGRDHGFTAAQAEVLGYNTLSHSKHHMQ